MKNRPWTHVDAAQLPTVLKEPAMQPGQPPDVFAQFGPGPDEAGGPPYVHVHQFPEEPEDGPPPEYVPFTVERMPRMRSQFGTCVSPTRVIPLTAERGDCRHCKREVVHGAGGWRLDDGTPSPQACASAPLGFHEA